MAASPATDTGSATGEHLLILSDGKPGHVNQSIAFARLLGLPFDVRRVSFASRLHRALTYLCDRLRLYRPGLFRVEGGLPRYTAVASAGSATYYANRTLAAAAGARSVAIMYPRGYRSDFDLVIAQQHDRPPVQGNILALPVNLSCPQPAGLVSRAGDRPCVALVIGGPSRHFRMDAADLERQIQQIFHLFPNADLLVTTSRRTPVEIEALVEKRPFRYRVIASRETVNPIADFLAISDYVFVTEDSTSMISEAVSFGAAAVEVLPLDAVDEDGKIRRMTDLLAGEGYLHRFDGTTGDCRRKVDLQAQLEGAWR